MVGEADAVLEGAAFGKRVGIVAEGFEQVEEKGLGFAFFVAFKVGGELGEVLQGSFERSHSGAKRVAKGAWLGKWSWGFREEWEGWEL